MWKLHTDKPKNRLKGWCTEQLDYFTLSNTVITLDKYGELDFNQRLTYTDYYIWGDIMSEYKIECAQERCVEDTSLYVSFGLARLDDVNLEYWIHLPDNGETNWLTDKDSIKLNPEICFNQLNRETFRYSVPMVCYYFDEVCDDFCIKILTLIKFEDYHYWIEDWHLEFDEVIGGVHYTHLDKPFEHDIKYFTTLPDELIDIGKGNYKLKGSD